MEDGFPIRVLHYIGSLELGGSQAFIMELYRNMNRTKVQFDFVTFPNEKGPLYDEIMSLGGKVYECPKYKGSNHFEFVNWWNTFLKKHKEYRIVHGHVRSVAAIYLPVVKFNKRFCIIHSHSTSNGKGIASIIKSILQFPIRFLADYYMACSIAAGEWLFGKRITNSRKYSTVPNAINTEKFIFDKQVRMQVRQQFDINDNLCIGHVGRFSEVKNHDFLLQVLSTLVKRDKKVRLLLVGDGPDKNKIEKKAANMGLSKYIIFTGAQLNTAKFYQAMDVFAFPSLWEGLGIAAIEAQSTGLPCVISDCIPKEVDIGAGLVTRLNINNDSVWAKTLLNQKLVRKNRKSQLAEVKKSGYDIKNNAKKLQRFYLKIAKSNKFM